MRNLPSLTAMAERGVGGGAGLHAVAEETLGARGGGSGPVSSVRDVRGRDLDENDALEREVRKRYETSVAGRRRWIASSSGDAPVAGVYTVRRRGLSPAFASSGAQGRGRGAGREAREESVAFCEDRLVRRRRGGTKGEG